MSANLKNAANRRYTVRLFALMAGYILLLVFAKWMFKRGFAEGALGYALAILPALPIIGVFWAVMRLLVEQTDEYLRMLLVRQCLFATGFALFVTTIREWLQNFDMIPAGDAGFGVAFFWFAGLGLGALFNKLTMGDAGWGGGCK